MVAHTVLARVFVTNSSPGPGCLLTYSARTKVGLIGSRRSSRGMGSQEKCEGSSEKYGNSRRTSATPLAPVFFGSPGFRSRYNIRSFREDSRTRLDDGILSQTDSRRLWRTFVKVSAGGSARFSAKFPREGPWKAPTKYPLKIPSELSFPMAALTSRAQGRRHLPAGRQMAPRAPVRLAADLRGT